MKNKIFLIFFFAASFFSCKKDYFLETEVAKIESSDVIYLGDEYVEVYINSTEQIIKGLCYSEKNVLPTINDQVIFITDWSYDGSHMMKLEDLQENVNYYCRIFIKKENTVVYSDVDSFTMKITPSGWAQKEDFTGEIRRNAVAFSIGNKGYMGLGSHAGAPFRDFWEYHPVSNSWTSKAHFPGIIRDNAVAFSIGNKGYVAMGATQEFWEYDPGKNSWTRKADFPGEERSNSVGFSIANKGYIGMGYTNNYNTRFKDFWEYDPERNMWTKKADFEGEGRWDAVGFSIGNKGYVGSGFAGIYSPLKNDFWEYDPFIDMWTQKADLASDNTMGKTIAISIENKGYIGIEACSYFMEYNPDSNSWVQKELFPGKRRAYAAGFTIGNKGYIGTGHFTLNHNWKDFWEFKP